MISKIDFLCNLLGQSANKNECGSISYKFHISSKSYHGLVLKVWYDESPEIIEINVLLGNMHLSYGCLTLDDPDMPSKMKHVKKVLECKNIKELYEVLSSSGFMKDCV